VTRRDASDLALRLARNKYEFGLELPPFSDDPWEDYLVSEAILVRWHETEKERQEEQREEQAFAAARQENEKWRQQHLRERMGLG
jgi:membrane-anchored protein YejM (alkaline phosphatase superfamily)